MELKLNGYAGIIDKLADSLFAMTPIHIAEGLEFKPKNSPEEISSFSVEAHNHGEIKISQLKGRRNKKKSVQVVLCTHLLNVRTGTLRVTLHDDLFMIDPEDLTVGASVCSKIGERLSLGSAEYDGERVVYSVSGKKIAYSCRPIVITKGCDNSIRVSDSGIG